MKDPQRLSMDEATSDLARSLLAAGRARREPDGARERVWEALAVGFAGGVVTASATGSAATGAASASAGAATGVSAGGASVKGAGFALALTKAKLLAIGGIATVASLTVVAIKQKEPPSTAEIALAMPASAVSHEKREANANAQRPSAKEEQETKAEPSVEEPAKAASSATPKANVPPPQVVGRAPVRHEAATPVSLLREEAALLHEIRAALTRGDVGGARTKLDEARARFPNSQLAPERDALEVRLASASGDHERAATLAREFVEHYPNSPLRAGIESSTRAPEKE